MCTYTVPSTQSASQSTCRVGAESPLTATPKSFESWGRRNTPHLGIGQSKLHKTQLICLSPNFTHTYKQIYSAHAHKTWCHLVQNAFGNILGECMALLASGSDPTA